MVAVGRAVTYSMYGTSPWAESVDTHLFERGHTLTDRGAELILIAESRFLSAPLPPQATMVMSLVTDCRIIDLPAAQARMIVDDGSWLPGQAAPFVVTAADHLSAVVAELLLGPPRGMVGDAQREEYLMLKRRQRHVLDQLECVNAELAQCVKPMEGGVWG